MNNLKFRVYHKEKGMHPVYGFNKKFVFLDSLDSPEPGENILPIKECELMQFTGRKDKNRNEIYEGDLLKGKHSCIYKVYWDNNLCCFASIGNEGDFYGSFTHTLAINTGYLKDKFSKEFEIIGNIHENPELIQQ